MIDYFANRKLNINLKEPSTPKQLKILVTGNSGTGKTYLLSNLISKNVTISSSTKELLSSQTEAVDMFFYKIKPKDKIINLNFWDFSGKKEFVNIRNEFYSESNGIIYIIDLSNNDSFLSLDSWLKETKRGGGDKLISILIGNNKNDKKKINNSDIDKFCSNNKIIYYEVSNINEFEKVINEYGSKLNDIFSIKDNKK
jgi:small GTP-binding protein